MKRSGQLVIMCACFIILNVQGEGVSDDSFVKSFHPTGLISNIKQVKAEFSTDIVVMGTGENSKPPFTLSCMHKKKVVSPAHNSRWLDSKTWILNLNKPLGPGIRCEFRLNEYLRDLKKNKVRGLSSYVISTAGPSVKKMMVPGSSWEIEPDQVMIMILDGAVDAKVIEDKTYFEVAKIPEKIKVQVMTGKDRDIVIKESIASQWWLRDFQTVLNQNPGKTISQIKELDTLVVLKAKRRFPDGTQVVFHWPTNMASTSKISGNDKQIFNFEVMKKFEATFSCTRSSANSNCHPSMNFELYFSNKVPRKLLKEVKLVGDDKKTWIPREFKEDVFEDKYVTSFKKSKTNDKVDINSDFELISRLTFTGPFPATKKLKLHLPAGIKDEIGRVLVNQNKFPLEIIVGEEAPLVKFAAAFGILERNADPILPLNIRNVEKAMPARQLSIEGKTLNFSDTSSISKIIKLYQSVIKKDQDNTLRSQSIIPMDQGSSFQINKPLAEKELELVGIPLKNPGFHVVEVVSPKLGDALLDDKKPMYVASAVLVTDMSVHFKQGRESSIAWVTRLSDAKPVRGAMVYLLDNEGKELVKGKTNGDGIFKMDKVKFPCDRENNLEDETQETYQYGDQCEYFVFASKDNDLSFTTNEWNKGMETYRYNLNRSWINLAWGPVSAHTILDRMIARPGEMVQMKHIIREYHSHGFSLMSEKRLPQRVVISHQESGKKYFIPLSFDRKSGSAISKFPIPKDATLGRYVISLSNKKSDQNTGNNVEITEDWNAQVTGYFIVGEYKIPLMKSSLKIQGSPLIQPSSVKVDLSAHYLSGGPAKELPVKIRARLVPEFSFELFSENNYNFLSVPVKTGIQSSNPSDYWEEKYFEVQNIKLNPDGGALVTIDKLPPIANVSTFEVEMEYTDPNGEIKTSSSFTHILPAEYFIGMTSDNTYVKKDKAKVSGIIVNSQKAPESNVNYVVEAFKRKTYYHRKRLVGGFYSQDTITEVISLGKVCEGKSDASGNFNCDLPELPYGSVIIQAKVNDHQSRSTYSSINFYIQDAQHAYFDRTPEDSNRIDLIAEKKSYNTGEKAKIEIKTPFKKSTVLVTVEREGILDSFVTEIDQSDPFVRVQMKENYAPNVFISAVVTRGRIGDTQPTAFLDLSRPSMKMGIIKVLVGWENHELKVDLKADRKKYTTRENVKVDIKVKTATGNKLPKDSEVVVVAVDEGLLRLKNNTSWKILEHMMKERDIGVQTYSGQNQVIGRRHFGAKAKSPGGGGGFEASDIRQLFDAIIYWDPQVKLNSAGEAKITIPLNDSITSFRIVAVATGGENLFGDGSTSIESSKDLIIYSGFAPVVRWGDQIDNSFTVRNTTAKAMKVSLEVTSKELLSLPSLENIELLPSQSKTLNVPMTINEDLNEISLMIKAKDSLSKQEDAALSKIVVKPAIPPRITEATLFQLKEEHQIPVGQSKNAIPFKGGIKVHATPSLVSSLSGIKSYMREYPYGCLEQKISRSIVLEDKVEMNKLVENLPVYFDSFNVLKFFPSSTCGSIQLTRYVMDILNENKYELPQNVKDKLLSGLLSYIQGKYKCSESLNHIRKSEYANEGKVLVMEILSRYRAFSPSMISTLKISPNLWKTQTLTAWYQLLKREKDISGRDVKLKEALNIILSRVNYQGMIMKLQGTLGFAGRWELFSSDDLEALSVFKVIIEDQNLAKDASKMIRSIITRMNRGRFDTTMANAWAVTLLKKFSDAFEKEPITGETKITLGDKSESIDWKKTPGGDFKLLGWPKESDKKKNILHIKQLGSGRPWIQMEILQAMNLSQPIDSGFKILRKIAPITQKTPGKWSVGDVMSVTLKITSSTDQGFVVVKDPIPTGATHLGNHMDGNSKLLDVGTNNNNWPMEFEEKSHSDFISYAAYLPMGTYQLSYRIRLNVGGVFKMPAARVEAMYSPDAYGEVPGEDFTITR